MNLLRLTAAASLVLTVSGLAVACSSENETAGGCAGYASAFISYTKRCSGGSSTGYTDARWSEYETRMRLACGSALTLEGTAINDGFLSGCAAAMRNAACGTSTSSVAACNLPPGKLADNAPCSSGDQCQSESCQKTSTPTSPSATCGTCAPRAAIGATCSASLRCVSDGYCEPTTSKCVAKTTSAVGGPCDSTKGQSCDSTGYCDYATKICKARAKTGEACGAAQCESALTCDPTSRTCVAPTVVGEGQACGTTKATCGAGLRCDSLTMKCVTIVWVKPGGDCSVPNARCEHGGCDSASRKCPALIPDGGACGPTVTGAICDDFASCVDGKCLLPGQVVCK